MKKMIVGKNRLKHILKYIGRLERYLRKSLFWGLPLLVINESIIQYTMACFLFILKPRWLLDPVFAPHDSYSDTASVIFFVICFISLLFLFVVSIRVLFVNEAYLKHHSIQRKYGVVWMELKTKSRWHIFYNLIFKMRRSLVCFSYLFLVYYNYF